MIRWLTIFFFGVAMMATACATMPAVRQQCLPMKNYTAAQEAAMSSALLRLAPDDPLVGAIADYGQLRAANRACASAHP